MVRTEAEQSRFHITQNVRIGGHVGISLANIEVISAIGRVADAVRARAKPTSLSRRPLGLGEFVDVFVHGKRKTRSRKLVAKDESVSGGEPDRIRQGYGVGIGEGSTGMSGWSGVIDKEEPSGVSELLIRDTTY